jgi:uncharacterized protein (TIGR02679 family)
VTGQRLDRLLGDPQLEWFVQRVRRRIELGQSLDATVTLAEATPAQRQAVQRLLGRPPRAGRALTVSLPSVDLVLRRSGACPDGLAAAVVRLGGPVRVRADAAAARERAWQRAFVALEDAVAAAQRDELGRWLAELRASGLVKRLEPDPRAASVLLGRLAAIVVALPAAGEPIGRFAARVAGGAHALDDREPLAALALGAARALAGLPAPGHGESLTESRSEAWAAVGLLRDELSSLVLSIGLPGDPATVTGTNLAAARDGGEPVALTLRQLARDAPRWGHALRGAQVRVCENPVVLALAADHLGSRCPPLVCTSGQPSAAVMTLLRGLAAAGARLAYHGDFDWGGIRIANVLHARLAIAPWRFDAASYEDALATGPGPRLRGTPTTARWDPALTPAMLRSGRAVEEESVLDQLLDDLSGAAG